MFLHEEPALKARGASMWPLQRLTRMRFHLIHSLTREKQYFLQNLFYKCNAFTSEVDSSVFGHAIMEMLSEKYSLDDIASMDVADLADYHRKKFGEVPRHQHKRALVLTARKLVRLVDALLRNDQLYTPRRKVNSAKG